MKYEDFQTALDKFIEDNQEIVEVYNQEHEIPLNQLTYRLFKPVCEIKEQNPKRSIGAILSDLLPISIASKMDLVESADDWVDSKPEKQSSDKSSLQLYFNDIKKIYDKNNNDYNIKYSQENRDKIIEMNLKSVITIAKKYKGMGVPLEDLISAGNLGLCIAFDRFDPERSQLKSKMIEALKEYDKDELTFEELQSLLDPVLQYGNTKKSFAEMFFAGKTYNKKQVKKWINSNVINARFNSVAVMWIRAYILIELNNNSRLIKKNKNDIKEEKIYGKDVYINLNDRFGEGGNNTIADVLYVEDETIPEQDRDESKVVFKEGLAKLLDGVKVRDRRILMQRFGIGYPRPMTPKEISQIEDLSIARISQIVINTIDKMKKNQEKWDVDPQIMYNAVQNLY